jgi:methionine biosynthesis protein MetW|tara:strand:- start:824 stop:1492 length:669 start_codon:yes stop_codon:yes gene_type:complete
MKPSDRENKRYSTGSDNPIDYEEEFLLSILSRSKGTKLLDVGCGVGTIAVEIQKRGFDVHGIDFSSVAIEKSRKKGINAVMCNLDEGGIPFDDNSFDIVWAGDIVEHVFDPIFLLKEILRVVKNQGKILITTPNDVHLFRRLYLFITGESPQSASYRSWGFCKHHTLFSLELLEYMLKEAEISQYQIYSVIKIPRLGIRRHTKSKLLGALLGGVFIIESKLV